MNRYTIIAAAVLAFAGCAQPVPPPVAKAPEPPAVTEPTPAVPAPAPQPELDVTLQVVKWPELEKAIESHKGKVVVLDVWAEW